MYKRQDESVAVATVAGVVTFRGKVIEGMSVSKGTPLVILSSKNMADGDPVAVSYTHLDVYKRQHYVFPHLEGQPVPEK